METVAVRSEIDLTLVSAEVPVVVQAALEYRTSDPFAVSVLISAGEEEVRWLLARDLLDEGLVHEVGYGDVQVVPVMGRFEGQVVQIRLEPPGGIAVLEASIDVVLDFLAHSYALVAAGSESRHLDLDRELMKLLAA